jgi:hypothetical protein
MNIRKSYLYVSERKHASHALTATEAMQTDTQTDPTVASEIAKQQILVQYLKVSNYVHQNLLICLTEWLTHLPLMALGCYILSFFLESFPIMSGYLK